MIRFYLIAFFVLLGLLACSPAGAESLAPEASTEAYIAYCCRSIDRRTEELVAMEKKGSVETNEKYIESINHLVAALIQVGLSDKAKKEQCFKQAAEICAFEKSLLGRFYEGDGEFASRAKVLISVYESTIADAMPGAGASQDFRITCRFFTKRASALAILAPTRENRLAVNQSSSLRFRQ